MHEISRLAALIWKELRHRWANAILMLLGVTVVCGLLTAFIATSEASKRETIRVTRDMGFNLRLIPRDADMETFWRDGFCSSDMPEAIVEKLSKKQGGFMSYNHLIPTLQGRLKVQDVEEIGRAHV